MQFFLLQVLIPELVKKKNLGTVHKIQACSISRRRKTKKTQAECPEKDEFLEANRLR